MGGILIPCFIFPLQIGKLTLFGCKLNFLSRKSTNYFDSMASKNTFVTNEACGKRCAYQTFTQLLIRTSQICCALHFFRSPRSEQGTPLMSTNEARFEEFLLVSRFAVVASSVAENSTSSSYENTLI